MNLLFRNFPPTLMSELDVIFLSCADLFGLVKVVLAL